MKTFVRHSSLYFSLQMLLGLGKSRYCTESCDGEFEMTRCHCVDTVAPSRHTVMSQTVHWPSDLDRDVGSSRQGTSTEAITRLTKSFSAPCRRPADLNSQTWLTWTCSSDHGRPTSQRQVHTDTLAWCTETQCNRNSQWCIIKSCTEGGGSDSWKAPEWGAAAAVRRALPAWLCTADWTRCTVTLTSGMTHDLSLRGDFLEGWSCPVRCSTSPRRRWTAGHCRRQSWGGKVAAAAALDQTNWRRTTWKIGVRLELQASITPTLLFLTRTSCSLPYRLRQSRAGMDCNVSRIKVTNYLAVVKRRTAPNVLQLWQSEIVLY